MYIEEKNEFVSQISQCHCLHHKNIHSWIVITLTAEVNVFPDGRRFDLPSQPSSSAHRGKYQLHISGQWAHATTIYVYVSVMVSVPQPIPLISLLDRVRLVGFYSRCSIGLCRDRERGERKECQTTKRWMGRKWEKKGKVGRKMHRLHSNHEE